MTIAEFIELTSHLDPDTEILMMSAYDFEDGDGKKVYSISDAEEMTMYHDDDADRPVIVLLFNDEDN